jgi:DNA-binding LacI/PurR family transcriptional regulator
MTNPVAARPTLFTIGHSNHEMPEFVALLARHGVDVIADVRSQPYSRFHGQFNREPLAASLKEAGIRYVFLGRELGARREERESYDGGQASYDLIGRLPAFRAGLERLRRGVASHRIALLCAEKDPISCHRTILVCRHLRSDPIGIRHILEDGSLETHGQAELRLLAKVGLPPDDLFCSREELLAQAYDLQGKRIAFVESEDASAMGDDLAATNDSSAAEGEDSAATSDDSAATSEVTA